MIHSEVRDLGQDSCNSTSLLEISSFCGNVSAFSMESNGRGTSEHSDTPQEMSCFPGIPLQKQEVVAAVGKHIPPPVNDFTFYTGLQTQ